MSDIETLILRNLQFNEGFARKVIPFLREEYFGLSSAEDRINKIYFSLIIQHFMQYNTLPSKEVLKVQFASSKLNEQQYNSLIAKADELDKDKALPLDDKWLLDNTEEFCKDQSLYLAVQETISIANGTNKNLSKTAIPDIMQKALGVSFDSNIGHDYIKDAADRWNYYNQRLTKVPFHLAEMNKITDGGVEFKTINAVMAGTGVGKTIWLCDLAANYAMLGYNVLYITMEVEEKKIAQRIDANLMNTLIGDVRKIPKLLWEDKIKQLSQKVKGTIKIKEYPTGSAHAGHFRALLQDLKTKQNWVPHILIVDQLINCASSRVKNRADMFLYNASITEELRALCQEFNMVGWTATQANRDGLNNSEMHIGNTGLSIGTTYTFDFYVGLIVTEELAALGQVMVKQLGKNRYGDSQMNTKFVIGLDRGRMRFHDLTNSNMNVTGQKNTPVTANTLQPAKHKLQGIIV